MVTEPGGGYETDARSSTGGIASPPSPVKYILEID